MSKKSRNHSAQFKFRVALEAIGELKTVAELGSEYEIHPTQVRRWKKEEASKESELYEQIGRLKMELEWLKKKLPSSVEAKRKMIETKHSEISIRRQCELIGLNRSSLYMKPAGETPLNLHLDEERLMAVSQTVNER